jgi:AcrR family transcriptional regulator
MAKIEEIIQVAARKFFSNGFDKTSMREIAKATNLTTAGLYYYIKDKEQLFEMVDNFMFLELEKTLSLETDWGKNPEKRIRHFIKVSVDFVLEKPFLYHIIREGTMKFSSQSKDNRRRVFELMRNIFLKLKKEGSTAKDIKDADITVGVFAIIAIINWLPLWYKSTGRINRTQLVESISKMVIKWSLK